MPPTLRSGRGLRPRPQPQSVSEDSSPPRPALTPIYQRERSVTEVTLKPQAARTPRDKLIAHMNDGKFHSAYELHHLDLFKPGEGTGSVWYTLIGEAIEYGYSFGRRGNSFIMRSRAVYEKPQDIGELFAGIDATAPEDVNHLYDRSAEKPHQPQVPKYPTEGDSGEGPPEDTSGDPGDGPGFPIESPGAVSAPVGEDQLIISVNPGDCPVYGRASLTSTRAILAKKNSGKTYLAMVIAEEFSRLRIPFAVIDPTGVWYGLCALVDGTASPYPLIRIGGTNAHFDVTFEQGALVADVIAANGNQSFILDISDMMPEEQHQFVADFGIRLYTINKRARHLFVDEADEFCMTADTEVLTDKGWKKHGDVVEGTVIAGYDLVSDSCSFENVKRKIERHHSGPMVSLQTRSLDCVVTGDHRVVLRRSQRAKGRTGKYGWTFCAADEVPCHVDIPGPRLVKNGGRGIENVSLDMLRVIGWILTDGCLHDRSKGDYLCLTQSLATEKRGFNISSIMHEVLTKLGADEPRKRTRFLNGEERQLFEWYLGKSFSDEIYRWLPSPMPMKNVRRVPRDLIERASEGQLRALYLGLMEGDGSSWDGKWKTFTPGHNEGLSDDLQEIASRLGISTTMSLVPSVDQWRVNIRNREIFTVRKPESTIYTGLVWDVTVPSGAFVARRNGTVFVTGNCPQSVSNSYLHQKRALGAFDRIVRRGRVKGLGTTLITQRPAVIHKNLLSQVDGIFVLHVVAPHDLEAVETWMKPVVPMSMRNDCLSALPKLQQGEAFFMQSGADQTPLVRFMTRKKTTFDSSKTPTLDDPEPTPALSSPDRETLGKVAHELRADLKLEPIHDEVSPAWEPAETGADDKENS